MKLINRPELKPRQRRAAQLLAQGCPFNKVANEVKVSDEGLRLWRKEIGFQDYLDELMNQIELEALESLRVGGALAARTILELMAPSYSPSTRLRAAQAVLKTSPPSARNYRKGPYKEGFHPFPPDEQKRRRVLFDCLSEPVVVQAFTQIQEESVANPDHDSPTQRAIVDLLDDMISELESEEDPKGQSQSNPVVNKASTTETPP